MLTTCPNCKGDIDLPESTIGGKVRCPYCEKKFHVELTLRDAEQSEVKNAISGPNIYVVSTGREYEECLYQVLKGAGYECELTPESCDQGVDLIVTGNDKKIAIQCKLYTSPVGNEAVQEVVAGAKLYGCTICCVTTNASYTQAARELASANGVALLLHSELLDYVNDMMQESVSSSAFCENYEKTFEYKDLALRAEKGAKDAREKIGEYYLAQLTKFAAIDLKVASHYFSLACHVGQAQSLMAYHAFLHAYDDDKSMQYYKDIFVPFGLIFQEMMYPSTKWELPKDDLRDIEYNWFMTLNTVHYAESLPLGHRRDEVLNKIDFVNKYWSYYCRFGDQLRPSLLYYLAICKLRGWGTKREVEVAGGLLRSAAKFGHLQAAAECNKMKCHDMFYDKYKGIYFIEGTPKSTRKIAPITTSSDSRLFPKSQLKSLDSVKDIMVKEVARYKGNAVVDFKYCQTSSGWRSLLNPNDVYWEVSGIIAIIDPKTFDCETNRDSFNGEPKPH